MNFRKQSSLHEITIVLASINITMIIESSEDIKINHNLA